MSLINEIKMGLTELDQDRKSLRSFAFVMAGALTVIGLLIFFFGEVQERAFGFGGIALILLLVGLTIPHILKPVHTAWMALAFFLGYFVSRILLSVIFFLLITPIGFVMRVFGKDFLNRKIEPERESYWLDRKFDADRNYERMF